MAAPRAGSPVNFHGFVEGDDIAAGTVDVVVTDGFTGNVALKTMEGTAKLYAEFLRAPSGPRSSPASAICSPAGAEPAAQRIDPRRYNGGIFLGLNGVAVKSHGGTDALGFANAIGVAVDLVRTNSEQACRGLAKLRQVTSTAEVPPALQATGGAE